MDFMVSPCETMKSMQKGSYHYYYLTYYYYCTIQLTLNNPNKQQRITNLSNKSAFLLCWLCSDNFGTEATIFTRFYTKQSN